MIPAFTVDGRLPPGIYEATWQEFVDRYGITSHRLNLIAGLKSLVDHLADVGCRAIYVDGSFVTDKEIPGDYDACWDATGVKSESLDQTLLNFSDQGKEDMEKKYLGDIRVSEFSPAESDGTYLEFFQKNRDGGITGIVKLRPAECAS